MTTEYSGQRQVYSSLSTDIDKYTVTIPVNPEIVITCEVSRGFIYSLNTGFSSLTTNPSVTFTLTNNSADVDYQCLRDIDGATFIVLTLLIIPGGELLEDTTIPNILTNYLHESVLENPIVNNIRFIR